MGSELSRPGADASAEAEPPEPSPDHGQAATIGRASALPPMVSEQRHVRAATWQHRGQRRGRVYTRAPWSAGRGGSSTPALSDTESETSVSDAGSISRSSSTNRVKRTISEASDCSELGEEVPCA